MCQRITCQKCGKPSFAGCGLHVESVLGDVPRKDRCQGHAADSAAGTSGDASPTLGKRLMDLVTGGKARGGRS